MVFFYEQKAMNGEPMPDDLDWLDQRMYIALRNLYSDTRSGVISRETGVKEKKRLAASYQQERKNEEFNRKWVHHTVQLWKDIEAADNQYRTDRTLEHADLLSDTILGLVKPDFDLKWAEEQNNET